MMSGGGQRGEEEDGKNRRKTVRGGEAILGRVMVEGKRGKKREWM